CHAQPGWIPRPAEAVWLPLAGLTDEGSIRVERDNWPTAVSTGQALCSQDRLAALETPVVYHLTCAGEKTLAPNERTVLPRRRDVMFACFGSKFLPGFLQRERAAGAEKLVTRDSGILDFWIAGLVSGRAVLNDDFDRLVVPFSRPGRGPVLVEASAPSGRRYTASAQSEDADQVILRSITVERGTWTLRIESGSQVRYGSFAVEPRTVPGEAGPPLMRACEDMERNAFATWQELSFDEREELKDTIRYWSDPKLGSLCAP
ncbi:MAG: hypothetical protein AAFY19_08455, partial [Pseudomonadota bacterium]